jgi:hypothetical protein
MTTGAKRSLLREAKLVMDATFVGGGDLAQKVRMLVKEAYAALANRDLSGAASKLVQAYELLRGASVDDTNATDFIRAVHALDLGLFLYVFAVSNDKERELGWSIWDARNDFVGCLYDAFRTARLYLSFISDGVEHEVAVKEAICDEGLYKLKEILDRYANKTQRGGNTGGDSEGSK